MPYIVALVNIPPNEMQLRLSPSPDKDLEFKLNVGQLGENITVEGLAVHHLKDLKAQCEQLLDDAARCGRCGRPRDERREP